MEHPKHLDTSQDINLSGTPSELQEIVDILREEVGTVQTETEDVHLKNSGSEVTFSQFCKGAEAKARNFRTSTQNQSVSEEVVAKRTKLSNTVEESVKMDPLEYYPSSSSLSSVACVSSQKQKKRLQIKTYSEKCSESVLKPLSDNSRSKVKINRFKPDSNKNKSNLPNLKGSEEINISDSESVKVVSSSSSDSDIKVIKNITGSDTKEIPTAMKQTDLNCIEENLSENSELHLCEIFLPRINNLPSDDNAQTKLSMCDEGEKSKWQNNDCTSKKNIPEKYFFKPASYVCIEVSLFVFIILF